MSLLINDTRCSSLHFVGILGSGMSALAQYLCWDGLGISGSDRLLDDEHTRTLRESLEKIGCRIQAQDGSGVGEQTDAVVVSSAIEDTNPDITAAHRCGVPIVHRSDVLAAIVRSKTTIAVAGTSGKSTVTALIFHLLHEAGKNPSLITGANLHALLAQGYIGNAFYGTSDLLVIEADESDGTCAKYHPSIALFLNVSKDHKPVAETLKLFGTLASQSQTVIANADDPALAEIDAHITFGIGDAASWRATLSSDANAAFVQRTSHRFHVPFPGVYMAMDLLAALCACSHIGVSETDLVAAAPSYAGLQRRFDRTPTRRSVIVIDDYAHNPDKIRAALRATQALAARVVALFQPHGYGPTRFMFEELVACFSENLRSTDMLFLLPIYYAGGTARKDVSSSQIAERLRAVGITVFSPQNRQDAVAAVASAVMPGDIVLSMGARDPSLPAFARELVRAIDSRSPAA